MYTVADHTTKVKYQKIQTKAFTEKAVYRRAMQQKNHETNNIKFTVNSEIISLSGKKQKVLSM